MWIPRDIEPRLQRSARTRPVVVLTGARQTGKTSTLRRLFPDHKFVSLDLPTEAEQAEKEPRGFPVRHAPPVIIDEVQYAPGCSVTSRQLWTPTGSAMGSIFSRALRNSHSRRMFPSRCRGGPTSSNWRRSLSQKFLRRFPALGSKPRWSAAGFPN